MKNTTTQPNTNPRPACAGKISQEAVRLNRKIKQDNETIDVLQTNSINDIAPGKGKAQFDEENVGLNKNGFRRL